MVLPALKRNLSHKPGLFSRATSNRAVGKVILLMGEVTFPTEKSFCKRERSFLRRRNHFANGSSHFSGAEVALLMGEVVFPAEKSPGKFAGWQVLRQKPCKMAFSPPERVSNGSHQAFRPAGKTISVMPTGFHRHGLVPKNGRLRDETDEVFQCLGLTPLRQS